MMQRITLKRSATILPVIGSLAILSANGADAAGMFGAESLNGDFVISGDGGFVALTPFSPEPLRLNVAIIGRLTFDGYRRSYGEWTIVFHNPAVPFNVRSHFETDGTYEIESDGHTFMEFNEYKIEPPADDDGVSDALVGFECYVVQRNSEAHCILNVLISAEQGPEPVTLSVSLMRQT